MTMMKMLSISAALMILVLTEKVFSLAFYKNSISFLLLHYHLPPKPTFPLFGLTAIKFYLKYLNHISISIIIINAYQQSACSFIAHSV